MRIMHLPENIIEKYTMGKLTEAEAAPAEEHLLVCQRCRDEVELIGLIIAGLREGHTPGPMPLDQKSHSSRRH